MQVRSKTQEVSANLLALDKNYTAAQETLARNPFLAEDFKLTKMLLTVSSVGFGDVDG
jgi:hypothetical protein